MSGPKCSSYEDTAARSARERAAAMERFEALRQQVRQFLLESVADAARNGVSSPQVVVPTLAGDAAAIDEARSELAIGLSRARAALRNDIASIRLSQLSQELSAATGPIAPVEDRVYDGPNPAAFDGIVWTKRLDRAVAEIPAGISDKEFASISAASDAAREAILLKAPPAKVGSLIDAVNDLTHAAGRRAKLQVELEVAADELSLDLMVLPGDHESERLFAELAVVGNVDALERLRALVAADLSRRRSLNAAEDRRRVLQIASDVLSDAGYDLGPDFATAQEPDSLAPTRSRDHALRVRERDGELLFNVVRIDPVGKAAPEQDAKVEAEWCSDFAEVRSELAGAGIELDLRSHLDPGQRLVEVMTPDAVAMEFGEVAAAPFVVRSDTKSEAATRERRAP